MGHCQIRSREVPNLGWFETEKPQLAQQEELIVELDRKIEEQTRPFAAEIDRLDAVPGVDHRVAEVVLAEVGPDMGPFPTHANLAYLPQFRMN